MPAESVQMWNRPGRHDQHKPTIKRNGGFIPLMSGLCLECLGDGTRRVVPRRALTTQ